MVKQDPTSISKEGAEILRWFDCMVSQGRTDPANPHLRLLPDKFLRALVTDLTPNDEMDPSEEMIAVCLFLLLSVRLAECRKQPVHLQPSEITSAINVFGIMLAMEELRRCGLMDYVTEPGWHNSKGQVWITHFRRYPSVPCLTPSGIWPLQSNPLD